MNQVLQYPSILNNSWNKLFTCLILKKISPFFFLVPRPSRYQFLRALVKSSRLKAPGEKRKLLLGGTRPTSHLIIQSRFLQSLSTNLPVSSNFREVGERGAVINYTLPSKTQDHQSIIRRHENQEKSTQIHLDSSRMKTDTRDPAGL